MDTTPIWAKRFDIERSLKLGAGAVVVLLRFNGRDATPIYTPKKTYDGGWFADRVRGPDGAVYVEVKIADVDGTLSALLDGDDRATEFAVSGRVHTIQPDKTDRPLIQPMVFTLRGVENGDTYTP